jgi:hypothetical protein
LNWKQLKRRYYPTGTIQADGITLYDPAAMRVERYRHCGTLISTPWNQDTLVQCLVNGFTAGDLFDDAVC